MVFKDIDLHVNVNTDSHTSAGVVASLSIAAGAQAKRITRRGHRNGFARALARDFANRLSFLYPLNTDMIDYAGTRYGSDVFADTETRPLIEGVMVTMSVDRHGAMIYSVEIDADLRGCDVRTCMTFDGTCGCVTSYSIGRCTGSTSHSDAVSYHRKINAKQDFATVLAELCVQYVCEMHKVTRILNDAAPPEERMTGTPVLRALLKSEMGALDESYDSRPSRARLQEYVASRIAGVVQFLSNTAVDDDPRVHDHGSDSLLVAARDAVSFAFSENQNVSDREQILDNITENLVMFMCGERQWAPFNK